MGMLIRLSQSAYLLGQVLRYTSDSTADPTRHQEEGLQLDRTLRALLNLSYIEGEIRHMAVYPQAAICYR